MTTKSKKPLQTQNWVTEEGNLARKSEAKKYREKTKGEEIGKKYVRVPHPTLKNTFILREKEQTSRYMKYVLTNESYFILSDIKLKQILQ